MLWTFSARSVEPGNTTSDHSIHSSVATWACYCYANLNTTLFTYSPFALSNHEQRFFSTYIQITRVRSPPTLLSNLTSSNQSLCSSKPILDNRTKPLSFTSRPTSCFGITMKDSHTSKGSTSPKVLRRSERYKYSTITQEHRATTDFLRAKSAEKVHRLQFC